MTKPKEKELVFHCEMYCPKCSTQHVDGQEWAYTPHHTHECDSCGFKWRVEPYCFGVDRTHQSIFERDMRCIGCGATAFPELKRVTGGYLVYDFDCCGCERRLSYRVEVECG